MKKFALLLVFLLVIFPVRSALLAAAQEWKFDRAHGSFYFDIQHIFHTTRGYFEDYKGSFRFDPDHPERSEIDITIKSKSITTHHRRRDRHLRSDDFLDAKRFPQMKFTSSRIRHVRDNVFEVEGSLTIKDVTRKISVPFTFYGVRENPFNSKQWVAGFEARFTIDRLEYHVGSGKYYEMGTVGKDVDILVSLEMLREK